MTIDIPCQADIHGPAEQIFGIPGSLSLLRLVIIRSFRTESSRTLVALKAYVDRLSSAAR
jgi:hypothetical protein